MSTKSGKATVVHEDVLIPVAYDGDCASVSVPEPTVDAALKSFEWKNGYVGFKFAQAVKATVKLDDGQEETFEQKRLARTRYLFATKVISLDDFAIAAEYKDSTSEQFRKMASCALQDKTNILFASERGLQIMSKSEQVNTVLVNKQGQQLFPPKND